MRRLLRSAAAALCLAVAACGGFRVSEGAAPEPAGAAAGAQVGAPDLTPEQRQAASEKESEAIAAALQQVVKSKSDYRISAADLISVTVYQDAEMSRKVRVNANGTVSLPLVGEVKVGGMTLIDAQAAIETRLGKYLVRPQVSLFIEDYGNKTIFVMGEVAKPGSYPVPTESRMTVLEAISTAGGFTPIAAQDRARVLRNVNGQSVTYTINTRAITQEGQKEKDMILEPNDIVYVPQSFF
ncbi:MAG: polysaccharide export protein [Elusimicrobiota bacterium]|nr:MAG: polysaccharide export protein [Elusimicrobiota bacterium]